MRRKKKPAGQALAAMPVAPRAPLPEECCGKGCTPCILDQYAEALEAYRAALRLWQARSPGPAGKR